MNLLKKVKSILLIFCCLLFSYGVYLFRQPQFCKKLFDSRPFITVEYRGQLGNRLFQTAAAISLALEKNCYLAIPPKYKKQRTFRKTTKNIPFARKGKKILYQFEEKPPFSYEEISYKPNMKLMGYFESEKYFAKHKEKIKELFSAPKEIKVYLKTKYRSIINHPKSVGIHVRTYYKDYDHPNFYNYFPAPDIVYIEKAIKLFDEDSLFVVCSDHIAWCKKNLSHIPRKMVFIEDKPYHDLYLLSFCKHMITSNSTFSWWAAYLNNNPKKKIVVRTPWFMDLNRKDDDIILSDWIRIEGNRQTQVPKFE